MASPRVNTVLFAFLCITALCICMDIGPIGSNSIYIKTACIDPLENPPTTSYGIRHEDTTQNIVTVTVNGEAFDIAFNSTTFIEIIEDTPLYVGNPVPPGAEPLAMLAYYTTGYQNCSSVIEEEVPEDTNGQPAPLTLRWYVYIFLPSILWLIAFFAIIIVVCLWNQKKKKEMNEYQARKARDNMEHFSLVLKSVY